MPGSYSAAGFWRAKTCCSTCLKPTGKRCCRRTIEQTSNRSEQTSTRSEQTCASAVAVDQSEFGYTTNKPTLANPLGTVVLYYILLQILEIAGMNHGLKLVLLLFAQPDFVRNPFHAELRSSTLPDGSNPQTKKETNKKARVLLCRPI